VVNAGVLHIFQIGRKYGKHHSTNTSAVLKALIKNHEFQAEDILN